MLNLLEYKELKKLRNLLNLLLSRSGSYSLLDRSTYWYFLKF